MNNTILNIKENYEKAQISRLENLYVYINPDTGEVYYKKKNCKKFLKEIAKTFEYHYDDVINYYAKNWYMFELKRGKCLKIIDKITIKVSSKRYKG